MQQVFEFQPFVAHFLYDYIRMAAYAMIILTSLRDIVNRKFSNILFVGDIIMAFAMFVTALNVVTTQFPQEIVADKVLTPAAVLWAAIHFNDFLKHTDGEIEKKNGKR